jgi:hypothetical protein
VCISIDSLVVPSVWAAVLKIRKKQQVMKRILFTFILALLLCFSHCQNYQQKINDIRQRLVDKYCPIHDFHGNTICPGVTTVSTHASNQLKNNTFVNKNHTRRTQANILGGLGFNSVSRTLVFPSLVTRQVEAISGSTRRVFRFNSVDEFLNMFEREQVLGGLFAESNTWISNFISTFGDYSGDTFISQQEYYTHKALAGNMNEYTEEFKEFLSILPVPFDSSNQDHTYIYRLFFDLFGTSVAQEVVYGGLVYMHVTVKKCFGGGNPSDDAIQELQTNIKREPPGSLSYLRYRRLGYLYVKGGNPELDIVHRIDTFAAAPAVLTLNRISLANIVPRELQVSIQAALNWYTASIPTWKQELQYKVQVERIRQYKSAKYIRVFIVTQETDGLLSIDSQWEGTCGCSPSKWVPGPCGYVPTCVFERRGGRLEAGQEMVITRRTQGNEHVLGKIVRYADTGHVDFIYQYPDGRQEPRGAFSGYFKAYSVSIPLNPSKPKVQPTHQYFDVYVVFDCEPVIEDDFSKPCIMPACNKKFSCACAGY